MIQTNRLVEENHVILRKMHRAALWGRAWRLLYWLVIIGISVGAYIYIQPYIDNLQGIYSGIGDKVNAVGSVTEQLGEVGKLIGR